MKILIIEDEQLTAEALSNMIMELRPHAEVLAMLSSVEESIEWLEEHLPPDLIFCDIHLSDGNSFEIFREVRVNCPIIFSTAYDRYALEAFQVNSIDYLLKPLEKGEIAKALGKYEELYHKQVTFKLKNLEQLLKDTVAYPGGQEPYRSRFLVKLGDAMKSVATTDIAYFIVDEGIVVLTSFEGKRYLIDYSLDQLEKMLDPSRFFRANRQLIVNIKAIREVKPYFKGRLILQLYPTLDNKVVVSSSKAPVIKEWLEY